MKTITVLACLILLSACHTYDPVEEAAYINMAEVYFVSHGGTSDDYPGLFSQTHQVEQRMEMAGNVIRDIYTQMRNNPDPRTDFIAEMAMMLSIMLSKANPELAIPAETN